MSTLTAPAPTPTATVHVGDMSTLPTDQPTTSTIPAAQRFMPAEQVQDHYYLLAAAGISAHQIAGITGLSVRAVRAAGETIRTGTQRHGLVDRKAGELILGVHADTTDLPADARVLAVGAKRRVQALIALGWTVDQISAWLRVPAATVDALLTPTTVFVSARAHRTIAKVYRDHFGEVPPVKDPASLDRARTNGWRTGMAWDDIDMDAVPASALTATGHGAEVIVDDVAVEQAMKGNHVVLHQAEREIVVTRLHAKEMSDGAISDHSGIPIGSVYRIRTSLGLAAWGVFDTAIAA